MAAPMPIGANRITIATNLNITSMSPSQKPSMASLGLPFTLVSAMANSVAQKTTWSTSLLAAASKKLRGTMCSRNPLKVVGAAAGMGALGSGGGRTTPTPGRVRLTAIEPDGERHGRHEPEVADRLHRQPADAGEVVAVAGDADH